VPTTVEDRTTGLGFLTAPANIVGPLSSTPQAFHVHAAGCKDLNKRIYRDPELGASADDFYEVTSKKDCVEGVYGPAAGSFYEEMGLDPEDPTAWTHYVQDFKFFPCISLPDYPIEVAK
jgi:hypothetical protein